LSYCGDPAHGQCLVLDEGHKVKNDATLTTVALSKIKRRHTVLLTGTPLQNNLRAGMPLY